MKNNIKFFICFLFFVLTSIGVNFFWPDLFREFYIVKIKNYSNHDYHTDNQEIADEIILKIYDYLEDENKFPVNLIVLYETDEIPTTTFFEDFVYINSDYFIPAICYGNNSYFYGVCCYRFDIEIWDCSVRINE